MNACNCTEITYSFNLLSTSLLMYLDGLKLCQCEDELAQECLNRQNSITSYHDLVYDRMCDPGKFELICNTSEFRKTPATHQEEIHCKQILQYNSGVDYNDWFAGLSPFCLTYGFGASRDVYNHDPSVAVPFNNMPGECKTYTIVALVILYLLCFLIIAANITVLFVVRLDQYFHTPYGYFKASIAMADLLVGIFVIPSIIYHFHEWTFTPRPFRDPGTFPSIEREDKTHFLTAVGFFTILTLSVSVYCLAASSLDRYYSIARPFRYEAKRFLTKTRSLILIIFIWILSAVFALLPIVNTSTTYSFVSATFILASEKSVPKTDLIFLWNNLFNVTRSRMLQVPISNENVPSTISNYTDSVQMSYDFNSTIISRVRVSSNTNGMYLILTMYLFSLFLPLVVVWIVNICTIRAFRKNKSKPSQNTFLRRERAENSGEHLPSSSPVISAASSALSLPSSILDEKIHQDIQSNVLNLENQVQTKLTNISNNVNFLTVPTINIQGRHSITSLPPRLNIRDNKCVNKIYKSTSMLSHQPVTENVKRQSRKKVNDLSSKMQKILLRMVIVFTICLFPAIACLVLYILFAPYTDPYSIDRYSPKVKLFQNILAYISSVFLFGNSFVNCIIYTVLGKRFREAAGKMYSGKITSIRQSARRVSSVLEMFVKNGKSDKFTPPKVVEHRV